MKDIKGWEGLYAVTEDGKIWIYPRKWKAGTGGEFAHQGKWASLKWLSAGYPAVCLRKDCFIRKVRIHRLVAETFIANPSSLKEVNHKNGIKTDNRVENLEWCSHRENMKHAEKLGLLEKGKLNILNMTHEQRVIAGKMGAKARWER
jgi:HNH endonuclease